MFLFSSVALVSQKFALSRKNFVYRFDCGVLVWEMYVVWEEVLYFLFCLGIFFLSTVLVYLHGLEGTLCIFCACFDPVCLLR